MNKQIKELLNDEDFANSLLKANNADEVRKSFAAKGVALADDLLEKIWMATEKAKTEELSGDALSSVAGGRGTGGGRMYNYVKRLCEEMEKERDSQSQGLTEGV
ncbi:hypothetical protein LJC49_04575 [Ruminococcaceae bacterium OttesenSCG-928-I18]|nr:hypothetical protein [Ruminococcaceae bacterium OttesenSCG-928-I18]